MRGLSALLSPVYILKMSLMRRPDAFVFFSSAYPDYGLKIL